MTGVNALKIVAYSEDKQEWESLSTVNTPKDSSGNVVALPASNLSNVSSVTFTAVGTHFSDYALSNPTGVSPPSTPSGLTATVASPTTGPAATAGNVNLSWSSVSDAVGYYLYRDTSSGGAFPLLINTASLSYSDTGLSIGTTYYYKVSAYKGDGSSESAASSAVNATPTQPAGGGGSPGILGGGGGVTAPAPVPAPAPAPTPVPAPLPGAVPTVPAATVAKPSPVALQVSPVFNADLERGARGDNVRRLQEVLASSPELYPEGLVTGFYGLLTEKAVQRFQKKYGVASEGVPGFGRTGPKTRAKLQQVFSGVPATEKAKPSEMAMKVSPVFTGSLVRGMSNDDVRRLQELLASVPDLYPEGIASGYFGALTEKAVGRFQEKYGVAFTGDVGYGMFGPKTRAKLSEVFGQSQ